MVARIVAAVVVAGLVGSGSALATPALMVDSGPSLGRAGELTIRIAEPDGIAEAAVFAPPGYAFRLDAVPGEEIGAATARVRTGGGEQALDGPVIAAIDADGCGPEGHAAVWRIPLRGAGIAFELLIAVDGIDPGAPESVFASYRLELCGPPAPGGNLVELALDLPALSHNPDLKGRHTWRTVVRALPSGDVTAEPVEARSIVPLPVTLTLSGRYGAAAGKAALRGSLRAGGSPVASQRVLLRAGTIADSLHPAGSATTGGRGLFEAGRSITRTTVFRASSDRRISALTGACDAPIASGGCAGATLVVAAASSEAVRVKVPPYPVLRQGSRGPAVRRFQQSLVELRYLPAGSVTGIFDERTWHGVVAFQGWEQLGRTGVVERRAWVRLERASVPRPWGGLRTGVEIDLARQVLLLVRGGTVVRAIHVSTGAGGRTPRGRFSVRSKALLSWSVPFQVWLPYAQYFYGGFAMHSYPSVPAYPASHGCVRLPSIEAPAAYAFTWLGMPVWIR